MMLFLHMGGGKMNSFHDNSLSQTFMFWVLFLYVGYTEVISK